jgi:hypothetical protein
MIDKTLELEAQGDNSESGQILYINTAASEPGKSLALGQVRQLKAAANYLISKPYSLANSNQDLPLSERFLK